MIGASGTRRAASLTEVLVALVILTIGLTSVIALFPVGVNRVRTATLDTRTTILAANAHALFQVKRMANDPAIVDLAAYDTLKASGNATAAEYIFDDPVRNPTAFTAWSPAGWFDPSSNPPVFRNPVDLGFLAPSWANPTPPPPINPLIINSLNVPSLLWPKILVPTFADWQNTFRERLLAEEDDVFGLFGSVVGRTDVQDVPPDYNLSYPVLLDPFLYDAMAFQLAMINPAFFTTPGAVAFPSGVPRINIATQLLSNAGTPIPGFDNYYGSTRFQGPVRPFADIAVLSLSEITLLPPANIIGGLTANQVSIDRETVKARWFASSADITFSAEVPGLPSNPSSQDFQSGGTPLVSQNYYEPIAINSSAPPSLANPIRATAQREYEFTWAAMFQRRLVPPKKGTAGQPEIARPNLKDREFRGKLAILCFYRRNLQAPYRVIEACFYTGSKVATLSWPTDLPAPTITPGTWLCEATISRSTLGNNFGTPPPPPPHPLLGSAAAHSGVYPGLDAPILVDVKLISASRIYRRAFSFHRVVAFTDPVDSQDGRTYQQVTLERPAVGFPLRYQNPVTTFIGPTSGQDDRSIDVYPPTGCNWPIFDRRDVVPFPPPAILQPGVGDETNCSQAQLLGITPATDATLGTVSLYFPVILFDGLKEVFEYNIE